MDTPLWSDHGRTFMPVTRSCPGDLESASNETLTREILLSSHLGPARETTTTEPDLSFARSQGTA